MEPTLSVIIPAYKCEQYIGETLKSLERQSSIMPFEVIISYDKSPDKTEEICQEYVSRNDNFVFLKHKERKGITGSRMAGIEVAKGKYVTFMDADDTWKRNATSIIKREIERGEPDIISFSFYLQNGSKAPFIYPFANHRTLPGTKALRFLQADASVRGFVWQKVYRKSLFEKRPLILMGGKDAMFEDNCFNFALFAHADKVRISPKRYYIYRKQVETSATTTKRTDRLDKHILAFRLEKAFALKIASEEAYKQATGHMVRNSLSLRYDVAQDAKKGGRSKKEGLAHMKEAIRAIKNKKEPYDGSLEEYFLY